MARDIYPSFATWMRHQGYAVTTVTQYQRVVRRWLCSHRPPAEWLLQVREASRPKGGGLPTTSAKTYEKALRAYHEFKGLDATAVSLPRVVRYRRPQAPRALTLAEEARFRDELDRMPAGDVSAMALRLMLDTGLRVSEACSLRLEHVQVREGQIVLNLVGKGGKERRVALPADTGRALSAYLRARLRRSSPWLFPSPQARGRKAFSTASVRRYAKRVAAQAAVDPVRPHELRHTVATRMAEAGVDQRIASAVLGHSAGRQTAAYQHPGSEAVRTALERAASRGS